MWGGWTQRRRCAEWRGDSPPSQRACAIGLLLPAPASPSARTHPPAPTHPFAHSSARPQAGFDKSGHPQLPAHLDLVEAEDQITHEVSLDDKLDPQVRRWAWWWLGGGGACVRTPMRRRRSAPDQLLRTCRATDPVLVRLSALPSIPQTGLNIFKVDPEYEEAEKRYAAIAREILGEDSDDDDDDAAAAILICCRGPFALSRVSGIDCIMMRCRVIKCSSSLSKISRRVADEAPAPHAPLSRP